jgi:hypothetical protein
MEISGCKVTGAGTSGGSSVAIKIKGTTADGTAFDHWFSTPPEGRSILLATALAAMTSGIPVWVNVETVDDRPGDIPMYSLYLTA